MTSRSHKSSDYQTEMFEISSVEGNQLLQPTFARLEQALWTEQKAKLISNYLRLFVFITKHGVYIDGFAGPQYPDQPDLWAAKLVLESDPKWMRHFFLCDKSAKQFKALNKLRRSQPNVKGRVINVAHADFNLYINRILESGVVGENTATFCLLDQRTFQCNWETVRKIASHKSKVKIEIFYFVPTGWLARSISGLRCPQSTMERWWGDENWSFLRNLSSDEVAEEFRRRFLKELGYRYSYSWPIYEEYSSKRVMYYMVHASDHKEAPNLMHRAYRLVTKRPGPKDHPSADQLSLGIDL